MSHIAKDVAHRAVINKEDALVHLTSGGWGIHAGLESKNNVVGRFASTFTGFNAGGDTHLKFDRSSTSSDRYGTGADLSLSARDAKDFKGGVLQQIDATKISSEESKTFINNQ
jgi:conjugal transfer mating pair stabilization protein TraG